MGSASSAKHASTTSRLYRLRYQALESHEISTAPIKDLETELKYKEWRTPEYIQIIKQELINQETPLWRTLNGNN